MYRPFNDWISIREDFGDDENSEMADRSQDIAGDYDKLRKEFISTVLSKYPEETIDFFKNLADRHSDNELRDSLAELEREFRPTQKKRDMEKNNKFGDDEVVPSSSDGGQGGGGNESE